MYPRLLTAFFSKKKPPLDGLTPTLKYKPAGVRAKRRMLSTLEFPNLRSGHAGVNNE